MSSDTAKLVAARLADGIPTVNDKGESTLLYLPGLRPHPTQPPEVAQVVTATLALIADAIVEAIETEYAIIEKPDEPECDLCDQPAIVGQLPRWRCREHMYTQDVRIRVSTNNGGEHAEIDMNSIVGQGGGVDYA